MWLEERQRRLMQCVYVLHDVDVTMSTVCKGDVVVVGALVDRR